MLLKGLGKITAIFGWVRCLGNVEVVGGIVLAVVLLVEEGLLWFQPGLCGLMVGGGCLFVVLSQGEGIEFCNFSCALI